MKPEELGIHGEALSEFMIDLDAAVRSVARQLVERHLTSGAVKAAIKITVEEKEGPDGMKIKTMKIDPEVSMKIGASAKAKSKSSNVFIQMTSDGVPIIGEKQLEIDNYIYENYGGSMSA